MKQDRFLLGILIGIAVVIVAALALFFLRQADEPDYDEPETTPVVLVHNYVVALQKGDYDRAFSYLANAQNKPDIIRFRQDLLNLNQNLSGYSLQIGDAQINGDTASVEVDIIQANNGPFGGTSAQSQNATLIRETETNSWKISSMPYPYWSYDWYQPIAPAPKSVPPG